MSSESNQELMEVLGRAHSGDASPEELAAALGPLEHLSACVPQGEMIRFLEDLDTAVAEKGFGNVKTQDAATPRLHGITLPDGGFLPCVFVDDDVAREHAVLEGLIEPDATAPFMAKPAASWFWDVLAEGHAGIVLEAGTEHEVRIDRGACSRIFALLNLEHFAGLEELFVLQSHGKLVLMNNEQHGTLAAAVYTDEPAATWAAENVSFPEVTVPAIPTLRALQMVLSTGVTHLLLDDRFRTACRYERPELERMVTLLGGTVPLPDGVGEAGTADPHGAIAVSSAAAPEPPAATASCLSDFPPIAPPGRDDDASLSTFRELRTRAANEEIPIWEYIDALAFDLDLYVLGHRAPVDGHRWPGLFRHPQHENTTVAFTFCREATARDALDSSDAYDGYLHLSGIEAMRWAWAAPEEIDEVAIELYPDTTAWISFLTSWVLSAIYPHFYQAGDLSSVARAPLARLGRGLAARGTQPAVVRALLEGWSRLVPTSTEAGAEAVIELAVGRYLPVFTSAESFFEHNSAGADTLRAGSPFAEAPFDGWARACGQLDGVVIDPGSDWPLTLDATELALLHLWEREGQRRPEATALAREVTRRLAEQEWSPALAGRVLADWPRYFICLRRDPEGNVTVLTLPDCDCCAVFSAADRADLYLEVYRQSGVIDGSWQSVPVLSRWHHSVFHDLARHFDEGGVIDPMPPEAGLSVWASNFLGESNFDLDRSDSRDGWLRRPARPRRDARGGTRSHRRKAPAAGAGMGRRRVPLRRLGGSRWPLTALSRRCCATGLRRSRSATIGRPASSSPRRSCDSPRTYSLASGSGRPSTTWAI